MGYWDDGNICTDTYDLHMSEFLYAFLWQENMIAPPPAQKFKLSQLF